MTYYVCKYTPVELLRGFGAEPAVLEQMAEQFGLSLKHEAALPDLSEAA